MLCVRHDGGSVEVFKSNLTCSCILPSGRYKVGLSCATVMFVFLWQPEVCVSVNLCPLPGRLLLLVQISVSSKKVTSQRLPELKCSWVLLNGRGENSSRCLCSSGCIVLLFFGLNLGIDGMSLSGEGSKTGTGYRISKVCSLSNCTLSHADRSFDIKERSTHPPLTSIQVA